jgi:hypothetical protein
MKRSLLLAVAGLALCANSSFAIGTIMLDTYDTDGPLVLFKNSAAPAVPLGAGWNAGLYYAIGDVRGSIASDIGRFAEPSTLGGGLTLATGAGSTATFYTSAFNTPGEFLSGAILQLSVDPNITITAMVIAYNGSSYASSVVRGHSDPFLMTTSPVTTPFPQAVGEFMQSFTIVIPEPSTFALAGISGLVWLACRRRRLHGST